MFYRPPQSMYTSYPTFSAPQRQPAYDPGDLARARYVRALREQRAARQAYADALAEREVRRLEEQQRRQHSSGYDEDADVDDDYSYGGLLDPFSQARARQREQAATKQRAEAQAQLQAAAERRRAMEERALAQAELEERQQRQLRYEQAKAYADAYEQQEQEHLNVPGASRKQSPRQQPYRKLGRVTPTPVPSPEIAPLKELEPTSARAPTPKRRTPVPESPAFIPTPAPTSAPAPTPTPSAKPTPPSSPRTPALGAIAKIASDANALRSSFIMPDALDFVPDSDSHKLSYAKSNMPIRAYEHALGALLERLDGVESAGLEEIRKARRAVVQEIEGALQELEGRVAGEWRKLHPGVAAESRESDGEMVLVEEDDEPVPSSTLAAQHPDVDMVSSDSDTEVSSARAIEAAQPVSQTHPRREAAAESDEEWDTFDMLF